MFTLKERLLLDKTWKKPKYPLTEEWIKKMLYMYTVEYYSEKKEIMPFAAPWNAARQASLSLSLGVCSNSCPLSQ